MDFPHCPTCDMIAWTDAPEPHVCPEPLPYGVAHSLAQAFSSPGAPPIHPRLYASIRLGLTGPDAPPVRCFTIDCAGLPVDGLRACVSRLPADRTLGIVHWGAASIVADPR